MSRRDPLANDGAYYSPVARRLLCPQVPMSSEEIDDLMRRTIEAAFDRSGAVVREDLIRAGVPVAEIGKRFDAIVRELIKRRGARRHG